MAYHSTMAPVPVKDEFRIADAVIDAAQNWRLVADGEYVRCGQCFQCVMRVKGTASLREIAGSLLAHLMQAHGWTRESTSAG